MKLSSGIPNAPELLSCGALTRGRMKVTFKGIVNVQSSDVEQCQYKTGKAAPSILFSHTCQKLTALPLRLW